VPKWLADEQRAPLIPKAVDAGFDVTEENVEAHLNFLADFGAKFDFAVALKLALEA